MFTAITVTRTFLRLIVGHGIAANLVVVRRRSSKEPAPLLRDSRRLVRPQPRPTRCSEEATSGWTHLAGKRYLWFAISLIVILPGVISLILFGLKLGIDFTGGTLWELEFEQTVNTEEVQRRPGRRRLLGRDRPDQLGMAATTSRS